MKIDYLKWAAYFSLWISSVAFTYLVIVGLLMCKAQAGPYAKYIHTIDYINKNKEDSFEQLRFGYETEGNFYIEGGVITNHLDKGTSAEIGYNYELVEGFTFDLNWEGIKRDNYNDVLNEETGEIDNVGSNKTFHQLELEIKYNF